MYFLMLCIAYRIELCPVNTQSGLQMACDLRLAPIWKAGNLCLLKNLVEILFLLITYIFESCNDTRQNWWKKKQVGE